MAESNILQLAEAMKALSREDVQVEIDRINQQSAPLRAKREELSVKANALIAEAKKISEQILQIEMPLRSLNRMLTRADSKHVPVEAATVGAKVK